MYDKKSSGLDFLDASLGGVYTGRIYLLNGMSGSGRTTIATQFVQAGLDNGEKALYVCDEPIERVIINADVIGLPIKDYVTENQLVLVEYPDVFKQGKASYNEIAQFLGAIEAYVKKLEVSRLVLDTLQPMLSKEFAQQPANYIMALMSSIEALGTTSMLVLGEPASAGAKKIFEIMENAVLGSFAIIPPAAGATGERIFIVRKMVTKFSPHIRFRTRIEYGKGIVQVISKSTVGLSEDKAAEEKHYLSSMPLHTGLIDGDEELENTLRKICYFDSIIGIFDSNKSIKAQSVYLDCDVFLLDAEHETAPWRIMLKQIRDIYHQVPIFIYISDKQGSLNYRTVKKEGADGLFALPMQDTDFMKALDKAFREHNTLQSVVEKRTAEIDIKGESKKLDELLQQMENEEEEAAGGLLQLPKFKAQIRRNIYEWETEEKRTPFAIVALKLVMASDTAGSGDMPQGMEWILTLSNLAAKEFRNLNDCMSRHLDKVLILLEECDTKGAEMFTMRITKRLKAYIKEQYHTKMGEGLNILTAAASYPRDRQTVDDLLTRVNNVRNYLDVSKHRFISVFTYQLFSILLLIVTFAFASDIELQRARQLKAGGIYLEAAAAYEKHLEANPDDNEARIELVLLLIDINRIPQAEIHVNELKKRDVKDPRLENAYFIVSQYRKSIQEAREKELKQNADDNAKSKVEYARLLAEMGKLDEALSEYNKYLANYPRDDAVRLEMAKRLAWNERYSECGVQISIILSHNPKDADALVLKGDIARWQGDDNTAVEMYKAALNAKPGFKAASKRLDEIYDQPAFREQRSKAAAEQNPGGPALLDLAEFYIEVNRIFEAEDLIRQRLTAYPDDTKAQRLLEIVKAAEKVYYGRRVKELESILVKTPRDYTANLELARLKRDLKDYQEAIRYFDKYVEHYPDDFIVRRERALILKLLKRTPEAVSEYRRLAAVKPDDRELRLELGEALLDDDRYLEEARMLFSSEKENTPDDPRVLLGLADAQRRLGNFPAARVIYENSLAQNPDLERAKEGLRTMETDKGLQIRNLERMLTIDSQDDATRRELVMLLLKVDRDFDAEKQAEILAQKNPDNDYDRDLLAEVKDARRKRLKRELAEVEGELALDPFNRDKRLKYAKLLASDGQKDKALKQYSILYEQNPDNPEVSMRLAEYLATEGDLEKAGRIYSDLVDKDRDNYEYRVRYAQTMSWLGEYEEAEKQYRIALTLDSDGIEAVIGLADTKRWRGEVMAAHDDYRRALEIDPDNEDAKKGLKALYGRGIPSLFITSSLQKDNETFRLSESRAGLNYKWNYNIFGEAGIGTVDLYQANRAQVSNAADNGSFVFGNIQWKYDRNTSIGGGLRNYFMGKRNSLAYSVFFERNLSEATEVNYLLARLEYVSQPAVFEIASTDGLYTWEENLITDRGTIFLNYQDNPKWYLNGRYSFIGITDGNDRNHGILEGGYILKSEITAGLTYETVSSSREVEGYWTPSSGFESVVIWGKIQGEDKQLSYSLRGAIGRVLSTNDPTYQIYGTLDYRASKVVGLSLAGSALVTTRKDGRYQYQAIMGRVSFNI